MLLPMTHALVPEDKDTCVKLSKSKEYGKKVPILLGGHEHDVYIDSAGNTTIVKVGQDAERIGVVDVWWTADGTIQSRVTMMPSSEFAPDPTCTAFVKEKHDFLSAMMNTPIAMVDTSMSSKKVRCGLCSQRARLSFYHPRRLCCAFFLGRCASRSLVSPRSC